MEKTRKTTLRDLLLSDGNGSSGGGEDEDAIIARTITSIENSTVSAIGSYAFSGCADLSTVRFAAVTSIGQFAFAGCQSLVSGSFPEAKYIERGAFFNTGLKEAAFPKAVTLSDAQSNDGIFAYCSSLLAAIFPIAQSIPYNCFVGCTALTSISFPTASIIGSYAFQACMSLEEARFPKATSIYAGAFYQCFNLISVYLLGSSLCSLGNVNASAARRSPPIPRAQRACTEAYSYRRLCTIPISRTLNGRRIPPVSSACRNRRLRRLGRERPSGTDTIGKRAVTWHLQKLYM